MEIDASRGAAAPGPTRPPHKAPAPPQLRDVPAQLPAPKDHSQTKARASKELATPLQLTSGFGTRSDPFTGRRKTHEGIDLAAEIGAKVKATRSGKVTFAGPCEGYGTLVIVDHGQGVTSRYGHLGTLTVAVGDSLTAGQVLGKVGMVGRSTGPHLHFEIHRQGRPVDPWPLLAGGKSRAWRSPL